MYDIDKSFRFQKLIGERIEQITFAKDSVTIFIGAENDYIQIMSKFELNTPEKSYYCDNVYGMKNAHGLLELIGKKIKEIYVDYDENDVALVFTDGYTLSIFDDTDYESYWIMAEGKEMLI